MKSHLHLFKTTEGQAISAWVNSRRRYGKATFYTWLYALRQDGTVIREWTNDPWPMVNPPRSGVLWSLRALGLDITPSAQDIGWLRRSMKAGICTHCSPDDAKRHQPSLSA